MAWKILITAPPMEKQGEGALGLLQSAGCVTVLKSGARLADLELTGLLAGVDAVLAGMEGYSDAVLQSPAAMRLKIISRWGVGCDAIDVSEATARGIVVTATAGATDAAVAEHTFALLLALTRRVVESQLAMRDGLWLPRWGNDLAGKTLGIVGFGRIGRAVARRARGFDLRLLAYDPSPERAGGDADVRFVTLDELVAQGDFVTLHAALTPRSRGIIGEAQLRRMKRGAFLVNTARGGLVDETALLCALNEGWIAGAALDVFVEEPLPPQHPLRGAPNLLLTPHQASATVETGERVSRAAAQAILDLMGGRAPEFVVNPEVLKSSALRAAITPR